MFSFFQGLQFTLSWQIVVGCVLVFIGILLWFIIRYKHERYWLPTIKILNLTNKFNIKLTFILPPLFQFLIFVLICILFLLFLFRPTQRLAKNQPKSDLNIYVILDLSPSVSAWISESSYKNLILLYWTKVFNSSKIMITTTAHRKYEAINSREELIDFLNQYLKFHSYGAKLDLLARDTLNDVEADKIFIFSDADKHSWGNFNWRYYLGVSKVFWVPVSHKLIANNIFINNVKLVQQIVPKRLEWEVQISRNFVNKSSKGSIAVILNDKIILEKQWNIANDVSLISFNLVVNIPDNISIKDDDFLLFKIKPESIDDDAISIDNIYREIFKSNLHRVVIIGDTLTEIPAEDPVLYLNKSFELLGFDVERYPNVYAIKDVDINTASLIILFPSYSDKLQHFCPIEKIHALSNLQVQHPILVWLASQTSLLNYNTLCECFMYLQNINNIEVCQHLNNRDDFLFFLEKIGAKQLGGEIGEFSQALAFTSKDEKRNIEFYVFSIPLKPLQKYGLTHGRFPLVLKWLLKRKNLLNIGRLSGAYNNWPRLDDLSSYMLLPDSIKDKITVELSNVPVQESVLNVMPVSDLPDKLLFDSRDNNSLINTINTLYEYDAFSVLKFIASAVLFLCLLEGLYLFIYRIFILNKKFISFLLLIYVLSYSIVGVSQIHVITIKDNLNINSIKDISNEVAQRTSIELADKVKCINTFKDIWDYEPWLWVRSLKPITDIKGGKISVDVIEWLKKGGTLIIENAPSLDKLDIFTKSLEDELNADNKQAGWAVIPPDHEVMRSFHLLQALPMCDDRSWVGFSIEKRLAILAIPYNFLDLLLDNKSVTSCKNNITKESLIRTFINILMVVLTTDYKKDQIHIPEILKRLK